jgi:hypothetical protein
VEVTALPAKKDFFSYEYQHKTNDDDDDDDGGDATIDNECCPTPTIARMYFTGSSTTLTA